MNVTFNVAVIGPANCSAILDGPTQRLLGSNTSCSWTSPATLSIAFSSATDTLSGTGIGLSGGVICRADSADVSMQPVSLALMGRKLPPNAVAAAMTSTGNSVLVTFDGPSSGKVLGVSSSGSCDVVLSNANLGQGALCVWSSLFVLEVRLGYAADRTSILVPATADQARDATWSSADTVVDCSAVPLPSSTLRIRAGAVTAVPGGVSKQPAQCLAVLPPPAPIVPVVSVTGPLRLGVCDPMLLDASGTVDSSGRSLDFDWSIEPPLQYPGDGSGTAVFLYSQSLIVPAGSLSSSTVYSVTVTATNFLGGAASVTVAVVVASTALPRVSIDGGSRRTVFPETQQVRNAPACQAALCRGDAQYVVCTIIVHWGCIVRLNGLYCGRGWCWTPTVPTAGAQCEPARASKWTGRWCLSPRSQTPTRHTRSTRLTWCRWRPTSRSTKQW